MRPARTETMTLLPLVCLRESSIRQQGLTSCWSKHAVRRVAPNCNHFGGSYTVSTDRRCLMHCSTRRSTSSCPLPSFHRAIVHGPSNPTQKRDAAGNTVRIPAKIPYSPHHRNVPPASGTGGTKEAKSFVYSWTIEYNGIDG